MRLQPYTKEWLEELCKDSISYNEVLIKAGRKIAGGNTQTLKNKISEYNIDISHFKGQSWSKGLTKETSEAVLKQSKTIEKYNIQDIFCKNSPVPRKIIRDYIKRHKLLEYKCQSCGNKGFWLNQEMTLELHHIDGDETNNELTNLQYLCPNCHSLTENYGSKNKKGK